jgi:biopolymer transport protein ExbB
METFIIVLLLLTSVVGVTLIIERALALRRSRVLPEPVIVAAANCRHESELPALRAVCERNPSPISRLLVFADDHRDWPKAETANALQTRARQEISGLQRGLVIMEIVVGVAPLMGLVGTIYGLILLFGSMGTNAAGPENAQFAAGIAVALNATLFGLLAAIPSLVAWSYFNRRVETIAIEMENVCDEFLRRHGASGEPR